MTQRTARAGPLRDPERYGPWALVTGASAGLGECYALGLAAQGLNVVLVARRAERLAALAQRIAREHPGVATLVVAADLTRADACETVIAATRSLEIGLLICNAGAARTGSFFAMSSAELLSNFDLNARCTVQLCHFFGAAMVSRRRGGIIVVSSIVGFTGVAGWAAYAAAKASGVSLALGLADECAKHRVAIQVLCPGHIRTEFHEHANIRALWPMRPGPVSRASLAALGRRRVVVPGWFNKFCVFGLRLLPRAFGARVYGWVLGGLRQDLAD
ncbi:MAG: SDR family NAD(P)-dependent oxidoreductase [Tahibacter sp.]